MSSSPVPPRRLAIAITAAITSTTVAVGVTAASLMGWYAPATPTTPVSAEPSVSPPVILVPITPSTPAPAATPLPIEPDEADLQVAMDDRDHDDDDEEDDE